MKLLMLVAIGLVLATCGGDDPDLAAYCAYSATSRSELRGCLEHIDAGESTLDMDHNAARYARGDLDACLRDAGPFCGRDGVVRKECRRLETGTAANFPACDP